MTTPYSRMTKTGAGCPSSQTTACFSSQINILWFFPFLQHRGDIYIYIYSPNSTPRSVKIDKTDWHTGHNTRAVQYYKSQHTSTTALMITCDKPPTSYGISRPSSTKENTQVLWLVTIQMCNNTLKAVY